MLEDRYGKWDFFKTKEPFVALKCYPLCVTKFSEAGALLPVPGDVGRYNCCCGARVDGLANKGRPRKRLGHRPDRG